MFANVLLCVLYFLQLNEYANRSIISSLLNGLKTNYLSIFLYLIILFLVKDPSDFALFELFVLLNISVVIVVLLGGKFQYLSKVKYTPRLIRLMACSVVLFTILEIIIVCVFNKWVYVLLLPTTSIFAYLFVYISLIILKPVELKINKHYLTNAKRKLSDCPNTKKVAITGSYGKTSTKEILLSILSQEFSVIATEKSFNTPMGICKTVNRRLRSTHEVFVAEMGAKKRGEIKELCDMVSPDIGVVVSVGRQHMYTFGSIENVYATKNELPLYLENKACVFNLDDKYVLKMYNDFKGTKIGVFVICRRNILVTKNLLKSNKYLRLNKSYDSVLKYFIRSKLNMVYAKNIILSSDGLVFDIYYNDEFLFNAQSCLLGVHNITNILLAVGVSILLNVTVQKIEIGINDLKQIEARLQKIVCPNGAIVLNNGYNACLDTSKNTLKTLNLFNRSNRVVVTPGLVECANQYEDNKLFGEMVAKNATSVIVVGDYNKRAITDGLISQGFLRSNIVYVGKFSDAKKIIDNSNENYVYLIENDLPENYC